MKRKLFIAWLISFPATPFEIFFFWGMDFSAKTIRKARRYNYEVRKAHITGDWTWLNKKYGT
jgi:hypothetical protein